jgi:hypothetical protein
MDRKPLKKPKKRARPVELHQSQGVVKRGMLSKAIGRLYVGEARAESICLL